MLCLPPMLPAMLMLPTLPSAADIVQQPVGGVTAIGLQTQAAILLLTYICTPVLWGNSQNQALILIQYIHTYILYTYVGTYVRT